MTSSDTSAPDSVTNDDQGLAVWLAIVAMEAPNSRTPS